MSCRAGKFNAYNAGGLGRLSRGFAEKAKSAADKALAGTCHLDSDSVLCTSTRSCSQVAGHLCCLTSRNTALDCARAAAEAADAANKATRQPTLYLAKEMGVVRQAKEMTSPKVGEIPVSELLTLLTLLLLGFSSESSKLACCRANVRWQSGSTVEVVQELEFEGRHRVQLVSPVSGWASVTAGDGTVLLEKVAS